MSEDHLDKETSVGVDLTPTGVKANAKSRTVAAIDRLCGNLFDRINVPIERSIARERALMVGERQMIDAIARYGVEKLGADAGFAQRVAEKHFKSMFDAQANTEAVVHEALDQLAHSPPTEQDAESGPTQLDQEFLNPFERYAQGASTERLRHKWGRVLSSEIRKPGTFSAKVLRVVDELDARTAELFERICEARVSENAIVKGLLATDLAFDEKAKLTSADLILEPGLGQILKCERRQLGEEEQSIFFLQRVALGIPIDLQIPPNSKLIAGSKEEPHFPVYVLTDVGAAIATILPNNHEKAVQGLVRRLKADLSDVPIVELLWDSDQYKFSRTL